MYNQLVQILLKGDKMVRYIILSLILVAFWLQPAPASEEAGLTLPEKLVAAAGCDEWTRVELYKAAKNGGLGFDYKETYDVCFLIIERFGLEMFNDLDGLKRLVRQENPNLAFAK